jgi:hypothetical protein
MTGLMITEPMAISNIVVSRGSGVANLLTTDPKEVWIDAAVGSPSTITIDLGAVRTIDTVFLGFARSALATTSWSITGGAARGDEVVIQATAAMRVPDVTGAFAAVSHGLWVGAPAAVRYLIVTLNQPAGSAPLSVGVVILGRAFVADLGREWGSGRRPIDLGTGTSLPSGGFSMVEGARKRGLAWTFGDLSRDETDQLELIALSVGETKPVLVIEDAARTSGLRQRIFYCKFDRWQPFDRRNRAQTKWELSVEEWV